MLPDWVKVPTEPPPMLAVPVNCALLLTVSELKLDKVPVFMFASVKVTV